MVLPDKPSTTDDTTWFRHLRVSPKLKSIGAYVCGAGFASAPPQPVDLSAQDSANDRGATNARRLQCYRFVYITNGSGVFQSRSHRDKPIQAGDMIMAFPKFAHRYRPLPDTGWKVYWIEFDGDYIRRLMAQTGFSWNEPVQYVGIHDAVLDLFLNVIAILKNEPPEYPLLLGSPAAQLIAQVVSTIKAQNHQNHSKATVIRETTSWLVQDRTPAENLKTLASRLNVSYSTFRHRFNAETGISPRQFALDARIRKASDLLAHTEAAPRAIAQLCGIETSYFYRLFKKRIGVTPTAFRQRQRRLHSLTQYQRQQHLRFAFG
jgi:AraC-like DNA-binding protein